MSAAELREPAADAPGEAAPDPDLPPRRPGESITDYRAVAFLLVLFLLALGLMYLIGRGR
jgi:hypothetical protein